MLHLGDVPAGSTLYIPFATYNSSGASVTMTGFAVTDIEIYKDGSVTQRASDNGYALLDTDGTDFDGITGIHGFSVDLSDNTTAGFYAVGSFYWVVVSSVTADGATVNFIAATFRIVAAESVAGTPKADVSHFGGTAGTFSGGRPEVNTSHAAGTAWNSGAIGAATLAADTLTAAKVAADVGTEIAGAVRTELTTELGRIDAAITTRASAADMTTALGYIDTEIAAILEDTGTTIPAQINALEAHGDATWATATGFSTHSADDVWSVAVRVLTASTNLDDLDDAVLAVLGTPAGASIADDIANIQAGSGPTAEQIADEVETRTLDANVVKVNNVTVGGAGTEDDPWGPA
jgi:hypothetical protein